MNKKIILPLLVILVINLMMSCKTYYLNESSEASLYGNYTLSKQQIVFDTIPPDLSKILERRKMKFADSGAPFNETDVYDNTLPIRQLIFKGLSTDSKYGFIFYNDGEGYYSTTKKVLFYSRREKFNYDYIIKNIPNKVNSFEELAQFLQNEN